MSPLQSTIAIVGLGISLLFVGAEGNCDERDARMFTVSVPTLILAIVVGMDLYRRFWS